MEFKAVKFRRDGFYSQPFVFGGEEGAEKYDPSVRYRGSLQNYLIDTGKEVILVDTGIPAGTPEESPDETSPIFTGKDICSYMEAFAALGYRPEQVTKILLTHRHSDHSGELRSFPNAEIYVNREELDAEELKGIPNLVPVDFTDGAYANFPESRKIADGIFFIKAKGHTRGNSLVIGGRRPVLSVPRGRHLCGRGAVRKQALHRVRRSARRPGDAGPGAGVRAHPSHGLLRHPHAPGL